MNSITDAMEKMTLVLVMLMTFAAILFELFTIYQGKSVQIADILLLFLYAEVLSMVRVYYEKSDSAFIYPILIAITALSRLIVLQGKDMEPASLLFEAAAVLILAVAIVLLRANGLTKLASVMRRDPSSRTRSTDKP